MQEWTGIDRLIVRRVAGPGMSAKRHTSCDDVNIREKEPPMKKDFDKRIQWRLWRRWAMQVPMHAKRKFGKGYTIWWSRSGKRESWRRDVEGDWRMWNGGVWNIAGDCWATGQRLFGDYWRENRQEIEETGRADSRPMKFSARLKSFRLLNEENFLAYLIDNIKTRITSSWKNDCRDGF